MTAHILVVFYALTGVVVQLYVPHFAELINDAGVQPLPALTVQVLHFQHALLGLAATVPVLAIYLAWRNRFRLPLSMATIVLLAFATLLEAGTAFALIEPMSDVLLEAEKIKPQPTAP